MNMHKTAKGCQPMKTIVPSLSRLVICTGFLTVLLYPTASPAATCEQWVAKVVSVEGKVDVRRAGETQWQPAKLNDTYCPGDVIRVQERSRADIALINQPVLRLDQNTTITLGGLKEGTSLIELAKGAAHFFSRLPRNLEIRTAFVNAGVEGTEGLVRVETDKASITIFEGKVLASNEAGSLRLTDGQSAEAQKGKAPVARIVVRPRDAVQWALYYPPIMDIPPEVLAKEDLNDPRFLAIRAASSLAVGRVDEANADIERALKINPRASEALAEQSVIAVVQNDKDKALNLAQQAVAADPKSSSARIALSFAQQAQFDLEGARKNLEEAVKVNPNDALAWARLAELRASFGELDKALEAAQKAVALNPKLERTQTVLGFAYLTKVNTEQAKAAFTKAIELDQAASLPRLGLGLAKFREGHVEEGRKDMEVAASLDPNNALVRSYLGKAFFEEKRDQLTEREFATAKQLDPKDPTPFFYDALQKQLTNRPVEALQDMEKAIELNDNRAVYRSKLQLDEDLAARSTSLARIYSNLGFQQLALVEGWRSLNTDPTSFSAHRFLADSYSVLPRHQIARVSELLVSQLLQPINVTPIQPSLAESNLFLLGAQGAASTSFNEFNTLMVNRDRVALQASGLVGSFNTSAGEGVASGIYKKASFSVGYSHFNTDGWRANGRTNTGQQDEIGDVFVQYELTPKTSVQAEVRSRKIDFGDNQLKFFKDDFSEGLRQQIKTGSARLGFHHELMPGSDLIANVTYQNLKNDANDLTDPATFHPEAIADQHAWQGEAAYLLRSQYVNLFVGGGRVNIRGNDRVTAELFGFPFIDLTVTREGSHTNGYLYSYLKPLQTLTATLGFSVDAVDAASPQAKSIENQVNPKFGLVWNPTPSTTIRAAAFKVLKRTLLTNQTIEPTQVAGFNQFFDDANTTSSWRYGGAIDQKFSKTLYGGVEYSQRDLDVPFFDAVVTNSEVTVPWKERQSRAYLFWTPHEWLAVTGEWLWEGLKRDPTFAFGAKTVETYMVPVGVSFFHPSGLSVSVKETYVHQQGSFEHFSAPGIFEDGHDSFWLLDAAINYRLPKRYGLITLGVTNLTNEHFQFFDSDPLNPRIVPERFFFARVTLALP